MKDWSKERWRKLYLREALEQRRWSVMARGLRDYLIRLAEDDGALVRDEDDPVDALLEALGAHADEAEFVRSAVLLLCRDGFLALSGRSIFVRNLPEAQTWEPRAVAATDGPPAKAAPASSKERVRRFRERQRAAADGGGAASTVTGSVTPDVTGPGERVTAGAVDTMSGNATPSRKSIDPEISQTLLDLQIDKQPAHPPPSALAREAASTVTRVTSVTPIASSRPQTEGDEDQFELSRDAKEQSKHGIKERALALRERPGLALTGHPEKWPEVIGVAQAFARGSGLPEYHLGEHASDAGVRSVLGLYAAGFTQVELERVAEFVPKQPWWRSKALGLSSLSPEVVRRNLSAAMASDLSPRLAKVLADVQRRREVG